MADAPNRVPGSWGKGILLQILACILYLTTLIFLVHFAELVSPTDGQVYLSIWIGGNKVLRVLAIAGSLAGGIAAANYGTKLFLKGRHLKVRVIPNAAALTEPFVLYLRPFESQSLTSKPQHNLFVVGGVIWATIAEIFFTTEEQKLARALRVVAPGVAVGSPDDKTSQLGFPRLYVSSDDWTTVVRDLMVKANLVVLRLGPGPGLVWELNTARELLSPERLLLLVPSDSSLVVKRGQLQSLRLGPQDKRDPDVSMTLPRVEHSLNHLDQVSVAGLIYFDAGWVAHAIPLETDALFFQSSLTAVLSPLLKRIGVGFSIGYELRYSLWFKLVLLFTLCFLMYRFLNGY